MLPLSRLRRDLALKLKLKLMLKQAQTSVMASVVALWMGRRVAAQGKAVGWA